MIRRKKTKRGGVLGKDHYFIKPKKTVTEELVQTIIINFCGKVSVIVTLGGGGGGYGVYTEQDLLSHSYIH